MKIRNGGWFHVYMEEAGDAGAAGGSGGAGGGEQNNGDNNGDASKTDYTNLWQDKTDTSGGQQQQQQNGQQQQQQAQGDPAADLQKHIESLNLTGGIDMAKVATDMQAGDATGFQGALQQVAENSYKAAMGDSQKMMQSQIAAAVDAAVSKADGNHQSSTLIRDMNSALPYTEAPEIAPIAKAVLTRFIKDGKSHKEAIAETDKFLQHVGTSVAASDGSAPPRTPGSGNYSQQQQSADTPDWDNIFAGL